MKNKILSFVLSLCVFAVLIIYPVSASTDLTEYTEKYYSYTVSGNEATITACSERIKGNITIPSTLGGYPVIAIGHRAFKGCYKITGVSFPDGLKEIGNDAFSSCSRLSEINIPDSVISIGLNAFNGTKYVRDFSNWAPDTGVYIDNYLIQVATKAAKFEIKPGTVCIADGVFSDCKSLSSVTIPDSVIYIGKYAFDDCSLLYNMIIPQSVTNIGDYAFCDCSNLTTIKMPQSIRYIGKYAFLNCTNLLDFDIPKNITCIGEGAFSNCDRLTDIYIPESTMYIGNSAFSKSRLIKKITVSENNENYSSQDGVLFSKDKTILIQYPANMDNISYVVPDTVKTIGAYAFSDCIRLINILIPDNVTLIGDGAFYACLTLGNLKIPDSVTHVGNDAFKYASIKSLIIPEGIKQ